MKLASDIAKTFLRQKTEDKLVEFITVLGGWKKLDCPTLSSELKCPICEGTAYHYTRVNSKDSRGVWICANIHCAINSRENRFKATTTPTKPQRALLWPKFCEINGIGDEYYGVRFEEVDQSQGKIAYMLKFANAPRGIILMQGDPGTGKTYAAMAICELYTRKDTTAIFTTQQQMSNNWLETFKPADRYNNYVDRVNNTCLLVIDDFGIAEPAAGFLSFFMNLINTRMQWTNRGTVITTNLDIKKFNEFCGQALADRIMTGQQFEFKGKTRRKKTIL